MIILFQGKQISYYYTPYNYDLFLSNTSMLLLCWYKLEIEGGHDQHKYNFIFSDNDCRDITGHSAQDLINRMHQDGEDDPKAYPELLDEMISRTLVLRVNVQPRSQQFSVMKAWDNPQYVRTITDHIARQETTSKLDKGKGNLSQELMSTSATS